MPEPIVREWVGHVDHEIIKHYTHVASEQSRNAMDRILPRNRIRDGRGGGQDRS